jgi:hypothetical protein
MGGFSVEAIRGKFIVYFLGCDFIRFSRRVKRSAQRKPKKDVLQEKKRGK